MNRTPHVVGGGINTIAKARAQQEQKRAEQEQRKADALAKKRMPQVDKAMEYNFHGASFDPKSESPDQQVVRAAYHEFLKAQAIREGNRTVTGAIDVAVAAAAAELQHLFDDDQTQALALRGVDWATASLKWAGRKLFNKSVKDTETEQVEVVGELVSA